MGRSPPAWMAPRPLTSRPPNPTQLNHIDALCGGTEIWYKDKSLPGGGRGDLIRGRPGDAFVFPGSLLHRGIGNEGLSHRFFYYASYAVGSDTNDGTV